MIRQTLRFFDYDVALAYYEGLIDGMRQAPVSHDGLRVIAKPMLILSIIKGVGDGTFRNNRFDYDTLNAIYEPLFRKYFVSGRQEHLTLLCYPFYFLQTDSFWHLSWKSGHALSTQSPSVAWLRRNVDYAFVDMEMWYLISDERFASRLKEYVINNKVLQTLKSMDVAAEPRNRFGFDFLASLLMVI